MEGPVTQFTNCQLLRDHTLQAEDLWVQVLCPAIRLLHLDCVGRQDYQPRAALLRVPPGSGQVGGGLHKLGIFHAALTDPGGWTVGATSWPRASLISR